MQGQNVARHAVPARACWAPCSCTASRRRSASRSSWWRVYLGLNVVVVVTTIFEALTHPVAVDDWWLALTTQHGSPLMVVGIALLVFPKLALGLSGFETGVAVMPLIQGDPGDTEEKPAGRIRGARRLLTTAAVIMSVFLITTSSSPRCS